MEQHKQEGTYRDLARYRVEQAYMDVKSAKMLLEINDYRGANNRVYYAIYHAISVVYALEEKAYKRHKDALGNFNKDYIRTEVFPKEYGKRIVKAEEIRHASDYNDFYIAKKEDTIKQIETAELLIALVEDYCRNYEKV